MYIYLCIYIHICIHTGTHMHIQVTAAGLDLHCMSNLPLSHFLNSKKKKRSFNLQILSNVKPEIDTPYKEFSELSYNCCVSVD